MIARDARARSGITLTEILIAILIMGVGLISLATLFPLGLLRLREATRNSRAGLAFETAGDEMDTRGLLYKPSFTQTWSWTLINKQVLPRDPFVQDAAPDASIGGVIASGSSIFPANNVGLDTGLPFCYDPLWRSITKVMPRTPSFAMADPTLDFQASYVAGVTPDEARFGAALFGATLTPYGIRPTDPDGGLPSAHGLQRLTNFIPWSGVAGSLNNQYPFTSLNASLAAGNQPTDVSGTVFSSNDDIVFNSFTGNPLSPSPLIPDMSTGGPQADYRFTWFFTGHQVDAGGNGLQLAGEIVVCDGRPFGWDPLPGLAINAPTGETAVEAVFGYGANITNILDNNFKPTGTGFATGADKTVLLRWPATIADPQVRVGGWICDVTYERSVATYLTRRQVSAIAPLTGTPFVRCNWYQVGKRTDPQSDVLMPGSGFRSMVLTITSPVKAKTLLTTSTGQPVHLNVALVMPSVINVFPRAFETIPIYTP